MKSDTRVDLRQATIVMLDVYWRATGKPRKPVRWLANTFGVCDKTVQNDLEALRDEGRIS